MGEKTKFEWKQKKKRLAGQDNHALLNSAQGVLKDSQSISRCPTKGTENKETYEPTTISLKTKPERQSCYSFLFTLTSLNMIIVPKKSLFPQL